MKTLSISGLILVLLAGCAKDSQLVSRSAGADGLIGMHITSSAFQNGAPIPKEYTADGKDLSPPLSWGAGPNHTKSYVLIVEDPDAPGKAPFVHWIVYGLAPQQTSLPEGASSVVAKSSDLMEGKNSKGLTGYVGPEPPPGKAHRYVFEVFAIDVPMKFATPPTKQDIVTAIKSHVLMQGELTGIYQR
jgi:hypothetical protein